MTFSVLRASCSVLALDVQGSTCCDLRAQFDDEAQNGSVETLTEKGVRRK
jgi:hypothetical protein